MTKKTITLAALVLASTALATSANAGGIRLSFGGPLGSFVAHPNLSSGPGGTTREKHCAKPAYAEHHYSKPSYVGRRNDDDEAPVRRVRHTAPKVEVAEEAPAPRKIAEKSSKPAEVKTAKLEDKGTISDAAPVIFIPDAPAPVAEFTGTQSTPAAVRSAALAPEPATTPIEASELEAKSEPKKDEATVSEAKPAKTEATEKSEKAEKSGTLANKVCRRFSAAVAGLITVPCD